MLVVDGDDWQFNGKSVAEIAAAFDQFFSRVEIARSRGEAVLVGLALQERPVLGLLNIWDLSAKDSPLQLPREFWDRLTAFLGRVQFYEDMKLPSTSVSFPIQIADAAPVINPDVCWCHCKLLSGQAAATLGLWKEGVRSTTTQNGTVDLHWITDEASHRAFWQAAVDVERDSEQTLQRMAPHAYPDLYFHTDVWRGLGSFRGGYLAISGELRRYLAVLDRDGAWAFTCPPPAESRGACSPATGSPTRQLIQRRFHLLNLVMAPENPNVKFDRVSRVARERVVESVTLYCEWHAKLEPHQNRIYLHAPTSASCGKLFIGFFAEHLPLP